MSQCGILSLCTAFKVGPLHLLLYWFCMHAKLWLVLHARAECAWFLTGSVRQKFFCSCIFPWKKWISNITGTNSNSISHLKVKIQNRLSGLTCSIFGLPTISNLLNLTTRGVSYWAAIFFKILNIVQIKIWIWLNATIKSAVWFLAVTKCILITLDHRGNIFDMPCDVNLVF